MAAIQAAIRQVLTGHDPYPRCGRPALEPSSTPNAGLTLPRRRASDSDLTANVLRASSTRKAWRRASSTTANSAHLLTRLRRKISFTGDPELSSSVRGDCAYPCDQPEPEVEFLGPGDIFIPLAACATRDGELRFFSIMATFGTPLV